jgi:hypothetical protein
LIDLLFPEIVYFVVGFTLGIGFESWSRNVMTKRRLDKLVDLTQNDIIESRRLSERER